MPNYEIIKGKEMRPQFNGIDAVFFDVDSTLVTIEGLDWLAAYKGKGAELIPLTKLSMEGKLDFNDAMRQKMQIIAPSLKDMQILGEAYIQNLTPGAEELIAKLCLRGVEPWILTGNFEPAVAILAEKLQIPMERVISNQIFFDDQGEYLNFDVDNPLAKNGGKAMRIQEIIARDGKKIAFVGDGMTDWEVKPFVELFIGFGGVAEREIVKNNSEHYISKPSLMPVIEVLENYLKTDV